MNLTNTLAFGWDIQPDNPQRYLILFAVFAVGMIVVFGLSRAPKSVRKPLVWGSYFFAGLFWVLKWAWPDPVSWRDGEVPRNNVESVGHWLNDAIPHVSGIAQTLTAFLLGLGIYSLLRVHLRKIAKRGENWQFSIVMLVSMVSMMVFGYLDFFERTFWQKALYQNDSSPQTNIGRIAEVLFDGLLQNMDAAMFSLIAFFIFSAAYRAFRIRSLESGLLMGSAIVVILSLMGLVSFGWGSFIEMFTHGDPGHFMNNFRLESIADWVRANVQIPALRALDFGVGLGTLAMGLRLWLGLDKGGTSV